MQEGKILVAEIAYAAGVSSLPELFQNVLQRCSSNDSSVGWTNHQLPSPARRTTLQVTGACVANSMVLQRRGKPRVQTISWRRQCATLDNYSPHSRLQFSIYPLLKLHFLGNPDMSMSKHDVAAQDIADVPHQETEDDCSAGAEQPEHPGSDQRKPTDADLADLLKAQAAAISALTVQLTESNRLLQTLSAGRELTPVSSSKESTPQGTSSESIKVGSSKQTQTMWHGRRCHLNLENMDPVEQDIEFEKIIIPYAQLVPTKQFRQVFDSIAPNVVTIRSIKELLPALVDAVKAWQPPEKPSDYLTFAKNTINLHWRNLGSAYDCPRIKALALCCHPNGVLFDAMALALPQCRQLPRVTIVNPVVVFGSIWYFINGTVNWVAVDMLLQLLTVIFVTYSKVVDLHRLAAYTLEFIDRFSTKTVRHTRYERGPLRSGPSQPGVLLCHHLA
ncbi:hypothetical protein M011DRAFT_157586 [Sporormia fimetaria CBS 119925]|uniref:Uncharacterized protein n=1 Tax=Sporormia fimetaria CBS 119925 TaxID=1340428 RepID=A0A6A6V2U9_9PLEO|nr:hypothetical protein M011DRAFT_157586 [Sporormia fimetaria CBS 119925]